MMIKILIMKIKNINKLKKIKGLDEMNKITPNHFNKFVTNK
jgi:hypothetical protein